MLEGWRMTALKLIGVLLVLVGVWAAYTALYEGTLEQPAYTVLTAQDGVEVRRYDPFVVASTSWQPRRGGLNGGFRELRATSSAATAASPWT